MTCTYPELQTPSSLMTRRLHTIQGPLNALLVVDTHASTAKYSHNPSLFERIDRLERWDPDSKHDDRRDVEEAVPRLHPQLMVAPNLEALARQERPAHLCDAPLDIVGSVLNTFDPLLATLFNTQPLRAHRLS